MEPLFLRNGLLLIDDDPVFRALLEGIARARQLPMTVFESLLALGSVGMIGKFDLAILDYDLGAMNGIEISEYVSSFFATIPVILISGSSPDEFDEKKWPACVRRFVSKQAGAVAILEAALEVMVQNQASAAHAPAAFGRGTARRSAP